MEVAKTKWRADEVPAKALALAVKVAARNEGMTIGEGDAAGINAALIADLEEGTMKVDSWADYREIAIERLRVEMARVVVPFSPLPEVKEEECVNFPSRGVAILRWVEGQVQGFELKSVEDHVSWTGDIEFSEDGDKVRIRVQLPDEDWALEGSLLPEEFEARWFGTSTSFFPKGTPAHVVCHVLGIFFATGRAYFSLFADGLFFETDNGEDESHFDFPRVNFEVLDVPRFEVLRSNE